MNSVKITSGIYKNRKLSTPGEGTHPMGERERLALFNMLGEYLEGALVLDAFAGSGALGIEALSRGAKKIIFVEKNPRAAKIIRQNLSNLEANGEVITGAIRNYTSETKFDIILADPPYDNFDLDEIELLSDFVKEGGILALSHPENAPEIPGMELLKTRQYAAAHISIYIKH